MNYRDFLQKIIYWVINPLIKGMIKVGITPNIVTFIGFLGNMVAAGMFIYAASLADSQYAWIGYGGWVLIFLWLVMREFGGSAYILMVLFNPLPLIFWCWRRYWSLPYAIILLIGTIVLFCLPHMLVDPAILVLALAYVVLLAKDSVKKQITNVK